MALANQDRIDAGIGFDWKALPKYVTTLEGVPHDAEQLNFMREGKSQRGFARLQSLKRAWLHGVSPEFLDEIARVESLEVLQLARVTATDLTPLARLRNLKRLIVHDATKVESLRWVEGLPPLDALALENFKRVRDLEPLQARLELITLGVEGSMWTAMRVASLAPLSRLTKLRSLFTTNLRVADRSLQPLHSLAHLGLLRCAAFYPDEEFRSLRRALPHLRCEWIDELEAHGSLRAARKAIVERIKRGSE
jgi:hypothetical protein